MSHRAYTNPLLILFNIYINYLFFINMLKYVILNLNVKLVKI